MVARIARNELLYAGCYAHVISRSIRKSKVFRDREDFKVFSGLLQKVKQEYGFKIYYYCLMQTHFHLTVKVLNVEQFSRAVQKLKSCYTYIFHTKYKISGPIWRERFKALLIENEAYLYACGQYIEHNPVRAGIVKASSEWPYSSSRHYKKGKEDPLVEGFQNNNPPTLIKDVDLDDMKTFEKGIVIGSGFFKFQSREKICRGVPK